jgi:release factor glutamine methyltransferase
VTDGPAEPAAESATVSWRTLLGLAVDGLRRAGVTSPASDARRIVEEASGWEGADHALHLDEPSTVLTARSFWSMLGRRAAGEPLQYVLGRWGFRTLDLYIDRRVLIPRPETEQVVEAAIDELDRGRSRDGRLVAVDLGTGSGAIALSLAAEKGDLEVWATDLSDAALAVARANLAGLGAPATRVRLVAGRWFDALPRSLRGRIDLVVSNPPYVAVSEVAGLPAEVAEWEPIGALVSGPTGLEAIEAVLTEAADWLARPGSLIVEHAPHQADAVAALARRSGFGEVETRSDLAGRARMLVARV